MNSREHKDLLSDLHFIQRELEYYGRSNDWREKSNSLNKVTEKIDKLVACYEK